MGFRVARASQGLCDSRVNLNWIWSQLRPPFLIWMVMTFCFIINSIGFLSLRRPKSTWFYYWGRNETFRAQFYRMIRLYMPDFENGYISSESVFKCTSSCWERKHFKVPVPKSFFENDFFPKTGRYGHFFYHFFNQ